MSDIDISLVRSIPVAQCSSCHAGFSYSFHSFLFLQLKNRDELNAFHTLPFVFSFLVIVFLFFSFFPIFLTFYFLLFFLFST
jgi:hypothetical protein